MIHGPDFRLPALLGGLAAGLAVLVACEAAGPAAPADDVDRLSVAGASLATTKVDVCHRDLSGDYTLITIADAAYDTHVDHGDASPGDPVPGMSGYVFDAACQPILAVCPCFEESDLIELFPGLEYTETFGGWTYEIWDLGGFARVSYDGSQYSCEIDVFGKELAVSPISEAAANACVDVLESHAGVN